MNRTKSYSHLSYEIIIKIDLIFFLTEIIDPPMKSGGGNTPSRTCELKLKMSGEAWFLDPQITLRGLGFLVFLLIGYVSGIL